MPDPRRYVAMGDSYSSGTGTESYDVGTDQNGNQCYRSPLAYPRVFASSQGLAISHVACNGARVKHILRESKGGEPPQVQTLTVEVGLVTITIGGNDIEFRQVIESCTLIAVFCGSHGFNPTKLITELRTQLPDVYREIRRRAPGARIFVIGYPLIIPEPDKLGPGRMVSSLEMVQQSGNRRVLAGNEVVP